MAGLAWQVGMHFAVHEVTVLKAQAHQPQLELSTRTIRPLQGPRQRERDSRLPEPAEDIALSLVAPVYNECENLRPLLARVREVFGSSGRWELILVDDGSRDGSTELIASLAAEDPHVQPIYFAANCGQTAAMAAGIRAARRPLIATLDADLQNDPADLPRMITALAEHDAIVGYRVGRRDDWLKRISSRVANWLRNRLTHDSIRDTGCSLKVFRAQAIQSLPLFDGMHRFLPTLLRWHGFTVIEFPVTHHPRIHGQSKYGLRNRAWRSFRDLMAVRWMRTRILRPQVVAAADACNLARSRSQG